MRRFARYALIAAGTVCVGLGVVGVFLPILPTTPFLVVAAALYARSSQRFHSWLMGCKYLGEYIRAYREGRGMSASAKAFSLSLLWLTLGSSAAFAVDSLHVRLLLLLVGIGVTTHLLMIPTYGSIWAIQKAKEYLLSRRHTMPLASKSALNAQHVGGKAAGLARLHREGLPVPEGFVISPAALRAHITRIGIQDTRTGTTSRAPLPQDRAQRLIESPLPRPVARSILRRYRRIQGAPVAVRSSATFEDAASSSCAGLLTTTLNVEGDEPVLAAVKQSWASLLSENVRSYLRQRGGDHLVREAAVPQLVREAAVLVQRMVPSLVAGVAFTGDPISGARHLVIEAAPGLAADLVAGRVRPSRYVIDPAGTILQSPSEKKGRLLPRGVLTRLSALLWRIDANAGCPQDVEWAWDGQQIWILQARPITTLQTKHVYSSRMVAEMSPGIIKPLVWSVNTSRIAAVWDRAFYAITGRHEPECYQLITLLHSRLYVDADAFTSLLARLGLPPSIIRAMFYGKAPGHRPRMPITPRLLKRLPRSARLMARVTRAGPEIEAFIETHDKSLQPLRDADVSAYDPPALLQAVDALMRSHADAQWYTKMAALNLMIRNAAVKRMARRWAPNVDTGDLLSGLKGVRSLQSGTRLRALGHIASSLSASERHLLLTGDDAQIRAHLAKSAQGRNLLAGMAAYMADFGFLNSNGTDFSRPAWIEQPTMIWRAIARSANAQEAPHAANPADTRPVRDPGRGVACRAPLARLILRRAVKSTRHHLALKEQCSLLMSEDSYHMHRLAEQLGRHLVHAGALTHADDVYYLTIDEIKETFRGQMPVSQARPLATERRTQIELDALAEPPEVIYGEWRSPTPVISLDGQDELQGIGASPGQAQGRARIVFDPAAVPLDVSPADILVVPFTDVGWMPLFTGIGGIVTECGGQLSHSAILAREFGLPAVLSVERATHLIREGQQISIDGTQGIIRLA